MTKQDLETLETLIDRNGLYGVVEAIESICHEKAEHVATNWQDFASSRRWQKAGGKFANLQNTLKKIQDPSFSI